MYQLNEKIKDLKPYDPIQGSYRVRLDANESFLPLPQALVEEAKAAVERTAFNRYPDPAARELCQAFAACYGVQPQQVVAGNGSDELITVLFEAFLEKGDAFATVEPDFSMYAFNGHLHEARHVAIPKGKDLRLDVEAVAAACQREQVKLLIFSNPCNPTSLVCGREVMRKLIDSLPDTLVVLDEAYMDFSDQSLLGEVEDHPNLLVLRTCSKAFGMAALRLGFAVCGKTLAGALRAVKSPYNVNSLSQAVGTAVLRRKGELDRALETILRSRDQLYAGLRELGEKYPGRFRLLPGETNFAALEMENGPELLGYLARQGVAIRYTGGLVRITCGAPEENKIVLEEMAGYFAQPERM
ncbi:MAG TPA: histidinol-phosphate aminotransferase family protein [Candidatus Acutalibacter pullistercoris]|uniref:Histidinol-phosphate aminotransferase n=1 Tax=Candidatus Acutalibacter pullistercoris TaxID=2838418 RepID=A0A9D1YC03_9FIRM|nr:histidinol-phosphate aminotransferase family protein [Candidatus Acutalibacter pullistercoris]